MLRQPLKKRGGGTPTHNVYYPTSKIISEDITHYWGRGILPGGGGGGGHSTIPLYYTRDHRFFEPDPKQVLSIGQIYTLFKYFRKCFFLTILPPKQV